MGFDSHIDEAMADIKVAMVLLRRNSDPESALYREALLEVNRTLAKEDTERALGYLNELLKVFFLSLKTEFPEIFTHVLKAHEHVSQSCRKPDEVHSIIRIIQNYCAISPD